MEKDEVIILEDRGFIQVNGTEAKSFLQNIVTNDLEKIKNNSAIFSSILTPQGKYLFEFFILKLENNYLLECEKKSITEIIKLMNFYKMRSQVDFVDMNEKYVAAVISLEKFKEINVSNSSKNNTTNFLGNPMYADPRNEELGAKIILEKGTDRFNLVEKNFSYYNRKDLGSEFKMAELPAALLYSQIKKRELIKRKREKI